MKAAPLDRLITFQSRGIKRDPRLGTTTVGDWADFVTVRAQMQDVLPSKSERLAETLNMARRPVRVRTRYRSDINSDMRIIYEGRTLHIVSGPAELGRREGLEMMAEEYTSGDETA